MSLPLILVPYSKLTPDISQRSIELQSPHIMLHNDELWLDLIKRDIPKWEEYNLPEKCECWYDVYCDLREKVQKSVDKDAEKMKMAMDGIKSERAKHSSKFVTDRRTVRLPRERPTAKQRYASFDRKMGGIAPVFAAPKSGLSTADPLGAPAWSFERPHMPRSENPSTSASRKKNSIFSAPKRNNVLSVPTKQLNNRATQVKQAPRALIEEHRRPAASTTAPRNTTPTMVVPGRSKLQNASRASGKNNPVVTPSLREKEERRCALMSGNQGGPQTSTSSPQVFSTTRTPPSSSKPVPKNTTTTTENTPSKATSQLPSQSPMRDISKPGGQGSADEADSTTAPTQAPRPVMRKRPAPSIFMPPKKRRMS